MNSVCVLISTYNGQKYLQEQLDSLYAQKGVSLTILARDDGSSDRSADILRANTKEHDCLNWYQGENLGPARSFLQLLEEAPEADYYAYCDQDDVWDEDKLLCAVKMLEGHDPAAPALYHSNLRLTDNKLRYISTAHQKPVTPRSRYTVLAEPVAAGCTMVMNRAARELLRDRLPERCKMHDEWTYLVVSLTGKVFYEFTPHISYRQHKDNVLSIKPGTKKLKAIRTKVSRMQSDNWIPRSVNAAELCEKCSDVLSPKDVRIAGRMASYRDSLSSRLRLLLEPRIHGTSVIKDLEYRIKVMLGIA